MMIVIFFILFTNVLADIDENKYIDLLPDKEKKLFLDQVARRIVKDVKVESNEGQMISGEIIPDEQLEKHDAYVRSILKEEIENKRRSKDKAENASNENLNVKPLGRLADDSDEKKSDLTLRNERSDRFKDDNDYIQFGIDTDEVPIIKRSIQNSNESDEYESKELPASTPTILESKMEEEERLEYEKESSKTKDFGITVVTTLENTTEKSQTVKFTPKELTSTLRGTTIKFVNTVSNVSKTELKNTKVESTRVLSSTVKDSKESSTTTTTSSTTTEKLNKTDDIQLKSNAAPKVVPKVRRMNDDSIESRNNTTEVNSRVKYYGPKSTESQLDENKSVTKSVTEEFTTVSTFSKSTTEESDKSTTDIPLTTQNLNKSRATDKPSTYTISIDLVNQRSNESTTFVRTTLTDTMIDEGTTEATNITSTLPTSKTLAPTIETTTYTTTQKLTEYLAAQKPVPKTDMKIIVEDFTSPPSTTTINALTTSKSTTTTGANKLQNKQESEESTQEISTEDEEESLETTTLITKPKKHKKKVKTTTAKLINKVKNKIEKVDKNFIELEKVYYNDQKSIAKKKSKTYQVFEIPPGAEPFIRKPETTNLLVKEQPYYVPVYNYAANNAYFNPQNRLGPNADDENQPSPFEDSKFTNNEQGLDRISDEENLDPHSIDMDYSDTSFDILRKKFGNQQLNQPGIHKTPQHSKFSTKTINNAGTGTPDDYLDSYYYFGRLRNDYERRVFHTNDDHFPNSDEASHPAHSIQNMNLKDHVRAVRNILFQQKFFGNMESNHDTFMKEEKAKEIKGRSKTKALKTRGDEYVRDDDDEDIAMDYYFGRAQSEAHKMGKAPNEYFKKVGYVKNTNNTKALYVIDETFKKNVLDYMQHTTNKADLPTTTRPPLYASRLVEKPAEIPDKLNNDPVLGKFLEVKKLIAKDVVNKPKTNFLKNVTKLVNNDSKSELKSDKKEEMNLKLQRRNDDVKVGVYLEVLKDMVYTDSKALKEYDWLGTAVDIQSSLQKLFELVALIKSEENMHPADLEILRYLVFIHKLAIEIVEANEFRTELRKKLVLLKNRQDLQPLLKEKGLISKIWLYLRKQAPQVNEDGALKNLNKFLMDIEDGLYDLHDAIKNIAKVTKYKNQHWYQNLKELYLGNDEKHLLELLLHVSVSRLYDMIEDSATKGLEDGYVKYMKTHRKESVRTLEEMLFVMQILDEINKFEE